MQVDNSPNLPDTQFDSVCCPVPKAFLEKMYCFVSVLVICLGIAMNQERSSSDKWFVKGAPEEKITNCKVES